MVYPMGDDAMTPTHPNPDKATRTWRRLESGLYRRGVAVIAKHNCRALRSTGRTNRRGNATVKAVQWNLYYVSEAVEDGLVRTCYQSGTYGTNYILAYETLKEATDDRIK